MYIEKGLEREGETEREGGEREREREYSDTMNYRIYNENVRIDKWRDFLNREYNITLWNTVFRAIFLVHALYS